MADHIPNPVETSASLKRPLEGVQLEEAHPHQPILQEDSAVTKAEKVERNGSIEKPLNSEGPASKKVKLEGSEEKIQSDSRVKVHGIALVKPE
jgi:tRNA-dihydrouridine synthase 3